MDKQLFNELCEQLLEPRLRGLVNKNRKLNTVRPQDDSWRLAVKTRTEACEICGKTVENLEIWYDLVRRRRRCNQDQTICPISPWKRNRPYK